MKRVAVAALIGLLISSESSYADGLPVNPTEAPATTRPSRFYIGPRVGFGKTDASYTNSQFSKSTAFAKGGFTAAVVGEYYLLSNLSIESGVEYVRRSITFQNTAATSAATTITSSTTSWNSIRIPLKGAYWIFDFLGAGAGLYYEQAFGDAQSTVKAGGTTTSSSASFSDSGLNAGSLGYTVGLTGKIALSESLSLTLGAAYWSALGNMSKTSGSDIKLTQMQGTFGMLFGF